MSIAITDEQRAVQESIRDWAEKVGTVDAVRELEPGAGTQPLVANRSSVGAWEKFTLTGAV